MATRYGKTFAALKGRSFSGKHYQYETLEDTKAEAARRARHVRQRYGSLARITKETSDMGRTFYIVWSRNKVKRS